MRSALDALVELGAWALPVVWLPVLVWTLAALAVETALRLRPGHPLVGLGMRRAMLWALPVGIGAALVLPTILPEAAVEQVAAFRPQALDVIALPTITVGVAPEAGVPATPSLPLAPLVAGLALLVVVGFALVRLARVIIGVGRLRQLSLGMAPEVVQQATAEAARAAGVTREVRAVATAVPTVPFTFGWRRPVVVVPAALAEDADSLGLVLAHEVAHVARGDFAASVAERVLTALFGWHPLVGALAQRVDLDRERATDAAVLAGHPSRRRDYASLLLSFSRLPSPALALGAAPGSHSLTTRITDMNRSPLSSERLRQLGRTARTRGLSLFLLAVCAVAFVVLGPTQAHDLLAAEPAPIAEPEAVRGATDSPRVRDEPPADAAPETTEPSQAMAEVIEGQVRDAATGQPVAGANVLVIGTQTGAATNPRGQFVIRGVDPDGETQIRIVHRAYEPMTVTPQAGVTLRINLTPNEETLEQRLREMEEREGERGGQTGEVDPDGPRAPEVFEVVEQQPRLIGGLAGLAERVTYPAEAKAEGVEGKVFVQFVVNEEGGVQDAVCARSPDIRLCDAALAAVEASTFEPGRQRGRTVKVRFVLPVDFRLPVEDGERP